MLDRSNKKILLLHLPQWDLSQPPMGIAYVGAYLKNAGYQVSYRDFCIEMYHTLPKDKKDLLEGINVQSWVNEQKYEKHLHDIVSSYFDVWILQVLKSNPDVLGFTTLTSNIFPTLRFIKRIKKLKPSLKIIVGGPFVARYDGGLDVASHKEIDFIITDEGEETALELIDNIFTKEKDYKDIKGILYLDENNNTIDTGARELIADISSIPFPNYEGLKIELYRDAAIPILGSRGCIFACTFCSETVFWKRFRYRPAENIVAEMEYHLSYVKNTHFFYIVDSLINGNMKELEKMCDLLIEKKIKCYWGGKASIRTQMTREILDKMYRAGCRNLTYGIESGSPKVLRDMRKGFTIPIAERVLKDTKDVGIESGAFFLVGFPTETNDDYELTKDFLLKNQSSLDYVVPGWGCGLLKGSEIAEKTEKFGIVFDETGEWQTKEAPSHERGVRINDFREFCSNLEVKVN